MFKSIISIILSVITVFSTIPNHKSSNNANTTNSDYSYSFEHTNSFGKMMSSALKEGSSGQQDKAQKNHIVDIDIEDDIGKRKLTENAFYHSKKRAEEIAEEQNGRLD